MVCNMLLAYVWYKKLLILNAVFNIKVLYIIFKYYKYGMQYLMIGVELDSRRSRLTTLTLQSNAAIKLLMEKKEKVSRLAIL